MSISHNNPPSHSWTGEDSSDVRRARIWRGRIVGALLLVSLIPLFLVGAGAWRVFHHLALAKTLELHRALVRGHASTIDLYLAERLRALELVATTHAFDVLTSEDSLATVFHAMRTVHPGDFVDLGVIDEHGVHRAYVGPYDLKNKSYADAPWFKAVLQNGSYVSDVFLGHRGEPHCVVAVLRETEHQRWILRATIKNESLYTLARSLEVGDTGDVYILNAEGLYQTPAANGRVLESSPWKRPDAHPGVRDRRVEISGQYYSQVATWINDGQWLVVVQQAESEIVAPIRQAMFQGALVVLAAVVLVLVTTFFATWHLTGQLRRALQQRDVLYGDLLRSAKLASLGELATGLAHEINNPLATISVEQTNVGDLLEELDGTPEAKSALERSVERCKRQIERCRNITGKMLQFGRHTDTELELVQVDTIVTEVGRLMEPQARVANVELRVNVAPALPKVLANPTELEQVLVNLINNSVQAIDRKGTVNISATRNDNRVEIVVEDDGCGIPESHRDKVFEPFFTTKSIGKGTGLGLAVSYGMVRSWGGTIRVDERPLPGTSITITLPVPATTKSP